MRIIWEPLQCRTLNVLCRQSPKSRPCQFSAKVGHLRGQRQIFRTVVVASKNSDAAKDPVVVTHHFKDLGVGAMITGINEKTRQPKHSSCTKKITTHFGCHTCSQTAAAFDAAVKIVNGSRFAVWHSLFFAENWHVVQFGVTTFLGWGNPLISA